MHESTKYKFIIVSPRKNGGGMIVLHMLCKLLCELGYDARIFYIYKRATGRFLKLIWMVGAIFDSFLLFLSYIFPVKLLQKSKLFGKYYNVSIEGCKRKFFPWADKRTIVVYPEIIYGNPLKAKNVVRWFLYYNKIYNSEHPDSYEKTDYFYCYRKIFNDYKLNPTARTLCISYFNLDLYRRYNYGVRTGKCYIIRKGFDRNDLPEHFDGIVIDNLPEEEIVRQFNQCEYCISYDMQSSYTKIAALCGCISILIPEEGKTREDYRKPGDSDYGEAFGFSESEIEYAKSTMNKVYDYYLSINTTGKEKVQFFADDCIQYFESKRAQEKSRTEA